MYRVLKDEMEKTNLTIPTLALMIGVSETTMQNKINGEMEFTWSEVCKIYSIMKPNVSKDELFETEIFSSQERTNVR